MIIPHIKSGSLSPSAADKGSNSGRLTVFPALSVEVRAQEASELLSEWVHLSRRSSVSIGPFSPNQVEEARNVLDRGARWAVVEIDLTEPNLGSVRHLDIPADRLLARITIGDSDWKKDDFPDSLTQILDQLADSFDGITLALSSALEEWADTVIGVLGESRMKRKRVRTSHCSTHLISHLHKAGIDVEAEGSLMQNLSETQASDVDLAGAFIACLRTDLPSQLYTTVVATETGVALGLVYSSVESIRLSLCQGRGIYFSRSRNGLWEKGATSGNWQELIQVAVDCDSDALKYTVVQHGDPGSFCHLDTLTCWGEAKGLCALERVLAERKKKAPPKSYTKRLFDDQNLLREKLVEEAQELAEAVEPDHVAAEAADLIYFALVRCAAAGVTIADIESHLDRRALKVSRRPGNAKQYRTDAADKILAAKSR